MTTLKEQLHQLCGAYISSREAEINKNIAELRDAAANDTKSSAGDKYETSREVIKQEIDLNLARLNEWNKSKDLLNRILPTQEGSVAMPGSVVYTDNGNFYLSISAGHLQVAGVGFYAISVASPIGKALIGKEARHSFVLNGKTYNITNVL